MKKSIHFTIQKIVLYLFDLTCLNLDGLWGPVIK